MHRALEDVLVRLVISQHLQITLVKFNAQNRPQCYNPYTTKTMVSILLSVIDTREN